MVSGEDDDVQFTMGVTDLWEVLSPVARKVQLDDLRGKKLAVDLSGWIVESERATQAVRNPVIRNLFYRCNKLLGYGIQPIFVLEGEAPQVKGEALSQRSQVRFGQGTTKTAGGRSRPGLQALTSQCRDLLDALGLPYVQGAGEAEGTCAYLDKKEMVDGCITQDGDAFLYGARTVYRKLCIDDTDPHVLEYRMPDIEEKLGLDREKLVALALLCGCDYFQGVAGVGKETVLKLLKKFGDDNCLDRLRSWSRDPEYDRRQKTLDCNCKKPAHCSRCKHLGTLTSHSGRGCDACGTEGKCTKAEVADCPCEWHSVEKVKSEWKVELDIRRKALNMDAEFPPTDVISEFLNDRDSITSDDIGCWKTPRVKEFEYLMSLKLNWQPEDSREKLFPLLTRWRLEHGPCKELETLKPVRIVKERVRRGADFYEVEWLASELWPESTPPNTLEPQALFEGVFPDLVKGFNDEQLSQKRSKKKVTTKDDGSNGDIRAHFKVVALGKQRPLIKDEEKGENVERPTREKVDTSPAKARPTGKSRTVVTRTRKPKIAPPPETMATLDRYYKKSPRFDTKSSESPTDSSSEDFDVPLSERIARNASDGMSSTELKSPAQKTDLDSARSLPRSTDVVELDSRLDEASPILVQEAHASGQKEPEDGPSSSISTSLPEPTELKALPSQSIEVFKADALDEESLILLGEAAAIAEKQPDKKSLSLDSTKGEPASPVRGTSHLKGFTNTTLSGVLQDCGAKLAASEPSGGDSGGCAASDDSRKPSWPASFNLSLSDSLVQELMTPMQVSDGQVGGVSADGSRETDVGCTPPKRRNVSPSSSSKRTPQSLADSGETSGQRSRGRRRLSFEPATSTPVTAFRNVEVKVERLTGDVVASVEMKVATSPGSSRSDSYDPSKSLFCFEEESQGPSKKGETSVIVISDNDD